MFKKIIILVAFCFALNACTDVTGSGTKPAVKKEKVEEEAMPKCRIGFEGQKYFPIGKIFASLKGNEQFFSGNPFITIGYVDQNSSNSERILLYEEPNFTGGLLNIETVYSTKADYILRYAKKNNTPILIYVKHMGGSQFLNAREFFVPAEFDGNTLFYTLPPDTVCMTETR